jgi:hypothetical protein
VIWFTAAVVDLTPPAAAERIDILTSGGDLVGIF